MMGGEGDDDEMPNVVMLDEGEDEDSSDGTISDDDIENDQIIATKSIDRKELAGSEKILLKSLYRLIIMIIILSNK